MTSKVSAFTNITERREILERFGAIVEIAGTPASGARAATLQVLVRRGTDANEYYGCYQQNFGWAILLGLQLLIAGDITRTFVAAPPNVLGPGLIVLICSLLSFSMQTGDRRQAAMAQSRTANFNRDQCGKYLSP